ncbi:TPA: HepT-like ribonuclease domain-containing protein [Enterococcus faecalis]
MRNMFAHSYSTMNERQIFRMVTEYIPVYKEFCRQELARLKKEGR